MMFLVQHTPFFVKNWKKGDKITYHVPVASWGLLESLGCPLISQNQLKTHFWAHWSKKSEPEISILLIQGDQAT